MLTSGQCRVVAYFHNECDIICADCAGVLIEDWLANSHLDHEIEMEKAVNLWHQNEGTRPDAWDRSRIYDEVEKALNKQACEALNLDPIIQYNLESGGFEEDGLDCECGKELVEQQEDEDEAAEGDDD